MKIIGNPDYKNPLVNLKNKSILPIRKFLYRTKIWKSRDPSETRTVQREAVSVYGDVVEQKRLAYVQEREPVRTFGNVIYTSKGIGILEGCGHEALSLTTPSIADVVSARWTRARDTIEAGTILESQTPYTYGDWVGDVLLALTKSAAFIREPIILPDYLARKSYAIRDLKALGLKHVSISEPVLVRNATVLSKIRPSYYWTHEDVAAYRAAFGFIPRPAAPGSILYLGRFDTVSESVQRTYPSQRVADFVRSLGGTVFDTRNADPARFNGLAETAETVIADQGSAVFGVMQWRTRSVIELAHSWWWHNANLFIAKGSGVENYAVINLDKTQDVSIETRIAAFIAEFGKRARST